MLWSVCANKLIPRREYPTCLHGAATGHWLNGPLISQKMLLIHMINCLTDIFQPAFVKAGQLPSDIEAELSEQKFFISVLNTCKNSNAWNATGWFSGASPLMQKEISKLHGISGMTKSWNSSHYKPFPIIMSVLRNTWMIPVS